MGLVGGDWRERGWEREKRWRWDFQILVGTCLGFNLGFSFKMKKKKCVTANDVIWKIIFNVLFDTSIFFMQVIMTENKFTHTEKIRNQINTIKTLKTKLKYDIKDKTYFVIYPLLFLFLSEFGGGFWVPLKPQLKL